ncbi:MAG: 2,3-bisphosphoglycerate-independent phosphoglycerate mutase [Syntrophales bacterium]|nr:2,3-bisphosphoglycerate-independent phosphoglycerate mutase [Syntrophales bacterium]
MNPEFIDSLVTKNTTKIVFLIMDGLGGLPSGKNGLTELEAARTPNLDVLTERSVCGLLDPVGYGITPGSGPAHFSLFGYDPIRTTVGRGLLSAAGINFPMSERDLFMRVNLATIDANGIVVDRRAGRIGTDLNRKICVKLQTEIDLGADVEFFMEPEKEHRALIALRSDSLSDNLTDSDPEATGKKPLVVKASDPSAQKSADIINTLLEQAKIILSGEEKANMILLRGFARYRKFKSLYTRYGLSSLAIAEYPMYQGIARLLGMDVNPPTGSIEGEITSLKENYSKYDFFFIHIKPTDSRGEDGDYESKLKVIEEVDSHIPSVLKLNPDVLVVTGDHSTPAALASHSWHPVPVLLAARTCRPDRVKRFGERDCIMGGISRIPMMNLMGLALAHAGRLSKFGA